MVVTTAVLGWPCGGLVPACNCVCGRQLDPKCGEPCCAAVPSGMGVVQGHPSMGPHSCPCTTTAPQSACGEGIACHPLPPHHQVGVAPRRWWLSPQAIPIHWQLPVCACPSTGAGCTLPPHGPPCGLSCPPHTSVALPHAAPNHCSDHTFHPMRSLAGAAPVCHGLAMPPCVAVWLW